jgi:hypothetical protein
VLVVQRVFRAKRTNLHEKYDYPTLANRDKLVDDLTAYVTEIAEQNGLLPVS